MKIRLIKGSDNKAEKKINEILQIYNTEKGLAEGYSNDYPNKSTIAFVKGIKGGVIVETVFKGGVFIYYAAFEEQDRNKGYLTQCIKEINKSGLTVYGVQLNPFDNFKFWARLGFVNQINFNWTLTYLNTEIETFKKLMDNKPNNENF